MTVAELLRILLRLDRNMPVVKTGADGQHHEVPAVSIEIGHGTGIQRGPVVVIK